MKLLQNLVRCSRIAVLSAAGWLALGVPALAQNKGATTESGGGSIWALAYGIVLLGIALGILVLTRSAHRDDKPRQKYE